MNAIKPRVPRIIRDDPFCWQSKPVRRAIRDAFDASNNVTTALAVYDALTEIASDTGRETFKTTLARIQHVSGVGISTIQKHLKALSSMGLVTIEKPPLRAPSTYTLHAFGNDCQSLGSDHVATDNDCASFGNGADQPPLPPLEEKEKKDKKKDDERKGADALVTLTEPTITAVGGKPKTFDEWVAYCTKLDPAWPINDLRSAFDHYEANGWKQSNGNVLKNWQAACRTCNARAKQNGKIGSSVGVPGANRYQMPAATSSDHAKGFFYGTEFEGKGTQL